MILRKSREFTINMGNYESVKIGASVEIDSDDLAIEVGTSPVDAANRYADEALTQVLEADIKEASELTSTRDSFILSWGKK